MECHHTDPDIQATQRCAILLMRLLKNAYGHKFKSSKNSDFNAWEDRLRGPVHTANILFFHKIINNLSSMWTRIFAVQLDATLDKDYSVPKMVDFPYVGWIIVGAMSFPEENSSIITLCAVSRLFREKNTPPFLVFPRMVCSAPDERALLYNMLRGENATGCQA